MSRGISGGSFQLPEPTVLEYVGTDTLYTGAVLAYQHDPDKVTPDGTKYVVKPSFDNIHRIAGVVHPQSNGLVGDGRPQRVNVIRPELLQPGCFVRCDENITIGDYLAPWPGTYSAKKKMSPAGAFFQALETVDRSAQPGRVAGSFGWPVGVCAPAGIIDKLGVRLVDPFDSAVSGFNYTLHGNSPTWVLVAGLDSSARLTAGNTNNHQGYARHTKLLSGAKSFWVRGEFSITDPNTDDGAYIFGLTDADVAGAVIADGGAAIQTSGNHAVFMKFKDTTVWRAESRNGATAATDSDVGTRDGNVHTFEIRLDREAATPILEFLIDGVVVHSTTNAAAFPSGNGLQLVFGAKSGSANATPMTMQHLEVWQ